MTITTWYSQIKKNCRIHSQVLELTFCLWLCFSTYNFVPGWDISFHSAAQRKNCFFSWKGCFVALAYSAHYFLGIFFVARTGHSSLDVSAKSDHCRDKKERANQHFCSLIGKRKTPVSSSVGSVLERKAECLWIFLPWTTIAAKECKLRFSYRPKLLLLPPPHCSKPKRFVFRDSSWWTSCPRSRASHLLHTKRR